MKARPTRTGPGPIHCDGNQELIAADRLVEVLPAMVEAAARGLTDANLTILNGTQGVSEVIAGLVGQGLSIFDTLTRSTPVNGHSRLTAPAPAPGQNATTPAPQG